MAQATRTATFYLTPTSADKAPGKGVREYLDTASFPAESLQALKSSTHWRRRLAALLATMLELNQDMDMDTDKESTVAMAAVVADPELRDILRHTCDADLVVSGVIGASTAPNLLETLRSSLGDVEAKTAEASEETAQEAEDAEKAEEPEPVEAQSEPEVPEVPEEEQPTMTTQSASPVPVPSTSSIILVDLSEDDDAQQVAQDVELEKKLLRCLQCYDRDEPLAENAQISAPRLRMLIHHCIVQDSLENLKWLHQNVRARPSSAPQVAAATAADFPWDKHAPNLAAELGHRDMLEYMLDNDCPVDPAAVCASAARGAQLFILQLLVDGYDAEMDATCVEAVMDADDNASAPNYGSGDRWLILKWILERGTPVPPHAYMLALKRGSKLWFSLLTLAHFTANRQRREAGEPLNDLPMTPEWTALAASGRRDPNLLHSLRLLGCPWDETCTAAAAARETPYLLQYARTEGCAWNESAVLAAIVNLRPENLAFCLENGCPFSPTAMHYRLTDALASASPAVRQAEGEACRALLHPRLPLHPYFYPSLTTRKRRRLATTATRKTGAGTGHGQEAEMPTDSTTTTTTTATEGAADVMRGWLKKGRK